MMRNKVSAFVIATALTSKVVTNKHVIAPSLVLSGEAHASAFSNLAIFVRMMSLAAMDASAFPLRPAHSLLGDKRVALALPVLVATTGVSHLSPRFISVTLALKGRRTSTKRGVGVINSATRLAQGGKAIAPRLINMKIRDWLPVLTVVAPLFTRLDSLHVFIKTDTNTPCGSFHCAYLAAHTAS